MRIIEPYFKFIFKENLTPEQFIELIGRTCYKSERNITQNSAEGFVRNLARNRHYAMLEHFWVHLKMPEYVFDYYMWGVEHRGDIIDRPFKRHLMDVVKYMNITEVGGYIYISCPIRVFVEMCLNEELVNIRGYKEMLSAVIRAYPIFFEGCDLAKRCKEVIQKKNLCY